MTVPLDSAAALSRSEKQELLRKILVERISRTRTEAASFAQERLWFLDRMQDAGALYNLPASLRLSGALDVRALERALGEIVRRHEALRTTFAELDGAPVQVIAPFGGFTLPVEAVPGADAEEREALVRRAVADHAARPFDLATGPLFRAALLRLDEREHVLLLCMHHIVTDGWSMGVFFRELSVLYEAYRDGRESPLAEPVVQYADAAAAQRRALAGAALDGEVAWWRERLAGAPALLDLPTDHPRPAAPTYRGAVERVALPAALVERLQALGRAEGATLYMVLLGAFQLLLGRYAGTDDVVVGSPIAGRTRREVEEVIGFFVNTLVLRTDLSGDPGFREVVRRVRQATLGAYAHQEVPFERLVAELQPDRAPSHSPLFQAVFALNERAAVADALPGVRVSRVEAETGTAKFDLLLTLEADGSGLAGELNYSTDLFERGTIRRMLGHLERVLEQVAGDADLRLSQLELLRPAERALVVTEWNRTAGSYPAGASIQRLFAEQAARTPDAVAVAFDDASLTYRELDERANRLAHHLAALGVGPEARVGLCLERGAEMVVSMLGILKAGGAYVPLDPSYPRERLAFMLADSAVRVLVTQDSLRAALPAEAGVAVVSVDGAREAVAAERGDDPRVESGPRGLAYVIYTSGSTGTPKGVAVEHRGVVRLVRGTDYVALGAADRVAQASNASFDAATFEIWGALLNGGAVVGIGRDVALSPAGLADAIRERSITTLFLTTALFNAIARERPDAFQPLSTLLFGGELVDPAAVRRVLRAGGPRRLLHVYGPTENTTFSSWQRVDEVADDARTVPIGRTLAHSSLLVLDGALRPLPVGVPGELYVGGDGVARGYLGRPALTAERFVPDPFAAEPGARMYRTGDRVRWTEDGAVEYLARLDGQVKVRGFRIEPGEIEAALRRHPGVADCAVLARGDQAGGRRVVAYVVGPAQADELRAQLRQALPEHMVPGAFVRLDALPLTPNGKVDRRALPEPEAAADAERYVAPRTPVEAVLAAIWAELLGCERVGVHDDFFELGGHSLLVTRVISRIRAAFGVGLAVRAAFEARTVELLARAVESSRAEGGAAAADEAIPRARRDAPLPVSFQQRQLWLMDRMDPGTPLYNVPAAWTLRGPLDVDALARALAGVVRRHEPLRTVFATEGGEPVQVVLSDVPLSLAVEDLSALVGDERERAVRARIGRLVTTRFDLERGPLFAAGLLRLGDDEHLLLLCLHHIVTDGWSLGVLFRELAALYAADGDAGLPPLPLQYADYAAWQRGTMEGERLERHVAWWRGHLSGAPTLLTLPTDRPRPAEQSHRGAVHRFALPAELSHALEALARHEGASLYMVLLSAFQVLLAKYARQDDVVVGSPIANRPRPELEALVGFFANAMALRARLGGDPAFREVVARMRETTLEAYAHQEVPFERLVEELQPERSLGHNPVFQAFFALHDASGQGLRFAGLQVEALAWDGVTSKFDLSLHLTRGADGLAGVLEYATDLFDRATVERMAAHLEVLLEAVAAHPERRLSALPLVTRGERETLLARWSGEGKDFPAAGALHQRFEARAAARPDAVAVTCAGESFTYGALNARANRLARRLRALGVAPEERVGLCAERSLDLIVGVLAILKAGAAYVPLDPAYPAERLAYMAEDSEIQVLLAQSALRDRVPGDGIEVVALEDVPVDELPDDLGVAVDPSNLAYVIYTSGSTGRPKGVGVTHGNVLRLFSSTESGFGFGEQDVWTLFHSYAFDFSVWEIWGALLYGGRLVVVPFDVSRDPLAFRALLERERVTSLSQTPSAFRALARVDEESPTELSHLRVVVFGGEALQYESLRGWLDRYGPRRPRLVNMYGITETTVHVTWHTVTGAELKPGAVGSGVGTAIPDLRAYVLDPAGQPAPIGVPGELYVGGAGLARGYLGRPGLTAQRFVPDPFGGEPGARLYRSGDLARWRAEGTLEYLGRIDQQVKVRGFRIELGEIEAVLLAQPGVSAAAVIVRGEGDEAALAAYFVPAADAAPAVSALREALKQRLPEYMVPAAFMAIDRIPLTTNGKLDRRALPAPEAAGDGVGDGWVAPRTPVEELLAGIWSDVLGGRPVGARDNFFELGGHSLLATRAVTRVREVFGISLPLRALFEAPTVAELAERVEALGRAELPAPAPVLPVERTALLPLSFAQERLWFLNRMEPESAFYNHPLAVRLEGALDARVLERALGEIVRRHEALRTTFPERDGAPVQVIAPFAGFTLPLEDLSALDEAAREAEVTRLVDGEAGRVFDLAAGPLCIARLLRLGEAEHVLLLSMHHIVTDGWSMPVLFRELWTLYDACREGRASPLPELAVQYADYAVWQRQQLRGRVIDRQLAYWRERLVGAPPLLDLPTDHPRPAAPSYGGAVERVALPAALVERLQALGRAEGATLYMVLLGAFQLLLGRYAGTDDVVVGSPIAGRTRGEVEGLIGFFVNTLVLRADLGGNPGFREVLRRVRDVTLGAYEHQDLPFERLVAELQPDRRAGAAPFVQVMFMLDEAAGAGDAAPPVRVTPVEPETGTAKFDLLLALAQDGSGLAGELAYSTDLFDRDTIRRMLGHLERVLEQVADDAALRASELELLRPAERALVLEEWNRTSAAYPAGASLQQLFAEQAARTPDAVAVTFDDASLTYRQLDERANRLAHHLAALGVGPEARVGLCLERGPELVVAILAILKAGGAYVPLDPAYPRERLAFMLADSAVRVLVTQDSLHAALPAAEAGVAVVSIDREREAIGARRADDPGVASGPRGLAYVIYTSGSTGTPKGVAVEHRSVVRLVRGANYASLGPDEVILQAAPVSFDASTLELWGALLNGGRLVLMPGANPSLEELGRALVRHGVTTLWLTAGLFQVMVQERLEDLAGVRQLLAGGDVLPVDAVARVRRRFPALRLINGYGPTENTTFTCCHTVDDGWSGGPVPIGTPISNTRVYVLDGALRPVPAGVPGELFAGGDGVARGYLGRPALTAERFVPDPFAPEPGARMYRTGDRVRRRADGTVEYLGRLDEQVKVRGFRVELGEIEVALRRHPAVADCAVVARGDGAGDRRVVAYVVGPAEADELRAQLRQTLPEHMLPGAIVLLDALPLTPNGKVDRRALPEPEAAADAERYVAPRTPVEAVLAAIWAELLGCERVGVHDDFFELGGHSLLVTRVISRIRAAFGVGLAVRAAFEARTVELLARAVESSRAEGGAAAADEAIPRARRDAPLPVSFQQRQLWLMDRMDPGTPLYNVPAAWTLRGPLDVDALARALAGVVRRHEPLRTVFATEGGEPVQVVLSDVPLSLAVEDLSALVGDERERAVRARIGRLVTTRFDLERGPLFAAGLLRLGDDEHLLLLCLHHIVTDGWSLGVLFRELAALYAAGDDTALPPLPLQYADYAAWQRGTMAGERLERHVAWWREHLSGAPTLLTLPTDRPRPAEQSHRGAVHHFSLSARLAQALDGLARREGASPYMVLLSAFQVLLAKYARQDDVVVGSPIANRPRPELEALVGFFANAMALRARLGGDPAFREVVARMRETTLEAYAHQEVPFERLVEELQPERSLGHNPVFQAFFALHDASGQGLRFAGLQVEALAWDGVTSKFDLSLHLTRGADGLAGVLEYATDLFDRATVERMAAHLEVLLEAVAAHPERRLSALPLVTRGERETLLARWSGEGKDFPAAGALHQRFEARAAARPDAVAVTCAGESFTYGALNARANRLARRLRALGVAPEERVGLCAERSLDLIVGVLAILKAGAAYVPLDPAYPAERLAYMAEDSEIQVLLAQSALRDRVPGDGIEVVALEDVPVDELPDDLGVAVDPSNLAYVIYTSGSTGRPKGVGVTHGNVLRLFSSTESGFGFGEQDVWTLFHSYAFDFSVWEIWGALLYGGRLVVVPFDVSRDPLAFRALLERERVTSLSQTPSAFRALARVDEESPTELSHLRVVVFGGEALQYESLRGWLDRYGPRRPRLVNMYGITETTVHVTWHTVTGAELKPGAVGSGVGTAIPDLRAYVLDPAGQPAPIGVPGELYVGGAGLARGYLGRPGLTAQRFVPDPFGGEPGARLYRSGDLARWRAEGTLEYLGRIDQQVKVRGFRIELGEIEAVLLAQPGVSAAAVIVRGEGDEAALAAYFVPAADAAPAVSALREALKQRLPEYMVPAAFMAIDRIPLTTNGKLDRRALPAPEAAGDGVGDGWVAPRTPVEEVLAGIWAEVLGAGRVGARDNFFELGGHSLLATRAVTRVREVFGISMPLRALFEAPTVEELAGRVEAERRAGLPALPAMVPVERTGALPLSYGQERLWFLNRMEPESAFYNHPLAVRLEGALDARVLERALGEIVRRHEALRTTFPERDGAPVQVIAPFAGFTLPLEDLSALDEAAREAEVTRLVDGEAGRVFDLAAGPLCIARLLRLGEAEHVLLLSMHHIVTDGWSMPVLFRELWTLYDACREGRASPLPELAVQYADYAVWQRQQLRGAALERQLAYWRQQLAGAPPLLELPTDRPRPVMQSYRGGHEPVEMPAALLERLEALARAEGATLYMVLLAAFQVLLGRYAAADDVVVGSAIAGRTRREVEELIGFFVNTLVLRADLSGNPGFREVLRRVREATLGAYEHQELPFERLVEELQPERSLSHSPLFQVMFLVNMQRGEAGEGGIRARSIEAQLGTTKFDLTLALAPGADGLRGELEYASDLFERGTMVRMLAHLQRVLEQVTEDPELPISQLRLLDADERRQVVEEWNRTAAAFPADRCIHQLFEAQAAATPDAVAVTFGDESLTYRELDQRANRLAHHLRRLGVGPEVRVGLCLERSLEPMVAILGVMKAGGAYVPVDPTHPAERLGYVLDDSAVAVLLTQERLRGRIPVRDGVRVIALDAARPQIAAEPADAPVAGVTPANLAYVIYTSGSTGRPKGVAMHHQGVVNYIDWGIRFYGADRGNGAPVFSSLAVDLTITNLLPLFAGKAVRFLAEESPVEALADALRERPGFGMIKITPTHLSLLTPLLTPDEARSVAHTLVIGADFLPAEPTVFWQDHAPDVRLMNEYGPTETVVGCSAYLLPAGLHRAGSVPVGGPIQNLAFYVLDPHLQPVPVGLPGELYIGGVGVARGYLGRPGLSAEKFVPDPFAGAGARMYRTGDRARWLAGGNLLILGRTDNQVKVRGFRVELGEIEAALRRHPGVSGCIAVVREDRPGDRRLVAYVAAEGAEPAALREHLRRALPEYMVPSAFVMLDALPQTATGKLDPRTLPAPEYAAGAAALPPRNELERRVAEAWQVVLGIGEVSVSDNFFDLGGTSLLLYRVFSRLRELRPELRVVDLFRYTTVEALAGFLGAEEAEAAPGLSESRSRAEARRAQRRRVRSG